MNYDELYEVITGPKIRVARLFFIGQFVLEIPKQLSQMNSEGLSSYELLPQRFLYIFGVLIIHQQNFNAILMLSLQKSPKKNVMVKAPWRNLTYRFILLNSTGAFCVFMGKGISTVTTSAQNCPKRAIRESHIPFKR